MSVFDSPNLELAPVSFFALSADCRMKGARSRLGVPFKLPNSGALCGEESFADVAVAWATEGFYCEVEVHKAFEKAYYPDVQRGDSVELFIDTRDIKTSGFNTRFCHHFFFLCEAVDGRVAGEITRFRTEDLHEWCHANDLQVAAHKGRNGYRLEIFIPAHCLHGYDPEQVGRLGFTYRINRPVDPSQHFSVVTEDFSIDQQPSLWASLRLIT